MQIEGRDREREKAYGGKGREERGWRSKQAEAGRGRLAGQALENRSFALGAENLTELTLLPNQTFRQL